MKAHPVFSRRLSQSVSFLARVCLLAGVTILAGSGCKTSDNLHGDFTPPRGAKEFEDRFSAAFDDSYTPTVVNLVGRAPNDVLDQRLFQARLGYSDVVALVRIEQVFGRGRFEGRKEQYLEVSLGEVLMGTLDDAVNDRQLLHIETHDDLPGKLKGEIMVLFLRWAPDQSPPFHHHMAPAQPESVALIKSMVGHAKDEGVINKRGREKRGKRSRRERRERKKSKAGKKKSKRDKKAKPDKPDKPDKKATPD